jgi:hypothetical protein
MTDEVDNAQRIIMPIDSTPTRSGAVRREAIGTIVADGVFAPDQGALAPSGGIRHQSPWPLKSGMQMGPHMVSRPGTCVDWKPKECLFSRREGGRILE